MRERVVIAGRRSPGPDREAVAAFDALRLFTEGVVAYAAGNQRIGAAYLAASRELGRAVSGVVVIRRPIGRAEHG